MLSHRLSAILLVGTTLCAVLVAVSQYRTVTRLRAETATLRQDLQNALASALTAPASTGEQAHKERLELIRLRHEVRQLQEDLVESRATQPTGLKGLIRPLLPQGLSAPGNLAPEWKGMEQHMTNVYAQAMQGVNNGTNELLRFLSLSAAAKMSLAIGRKEDARRFAQDSLFLNEKYSRGASDKSRGDAVHDANLVLGRIAMEENRIDEAKRLLLAAGQSTGSPSLSSFGPNMGLAKDLLERGEQAVVLEYFELCRKFWSNDEKLNEWKRDVEAGRIPEFQANLLY